MRLPCIAAVAVLLGALACPAAHAATETASGILNIQSDPAGAVVVVDGRIRGTTPLLLEVPATRHHVEVRHRDFDAARADIAVEPDRVARVHFTLQSRATPVTSATPLRTAEIRVHQPDPDTAPGTVFLVTTPPGLLPAVNGHPVGTPTPVAFDIRPGIYELTLHNQSNAVVYRKTIFVRSNQTLSLEIVVQKKRAIDYTDPWQ